MLLKTPFPWLLFFCTLFLNACQNKKEPAILRNVSLNEALQAAKDNQKGLLLLSGQTDCHVCKLFETDYITNQAFKNIIDSNFVVARINFTDSGQQWLAALLHSGTFPTFAVLDKQLQTKAVIAGNISLADMRKYVAGIAAGNSYVEMTRFKDSSQVSKAEYIRATNANFQDKAKTDSIFAKIITAPLFMQAYAKLLETHVQQRPSFYNQQLTARFFRFTGDTLRARQYATVALSGITPLTALLNVQALKEMRLIIDPAYNEKNEPFIHAISDTAHMGIVKNHSTTSVPYPITNTGKKPLVIQAVYTDCACTAATFDKAAILPGDSSVVHLTFSAKGEGNVRRTLRIYSNAANNPLQATLTGEVAP
ncbi:Thioredoxin-related protein [Filimonas lacunae]|uniref:Thioredoxin-related protein n=1 Tax=Filimonas lacunae TaxID=477680 RepID=A0A173MES6_9BACT|nr:DUF1573 domain-containing protein [Filimonas lacunae]BAV05938.1 hypothetical protein FLA_1951 [Filimonas lacunae]SIT23818.1 Thioredoxin-related protein [Filimonas lacunae]